MPKYLKTRLSLLLFLQLLVWASWLINLGTYLLQTLHFSGREVGMIYATNAIAATVTPPVMGWLADHKFSSEKLMAALNVLGGISLLGCFYSTTFLPFYLWMLLFNLSFIPNFSLEAGMCFYHLDDPSRQYPAVRVWGTVSFMLMGVFLSYFTLEASAIPLLFGSITALLTAGYCLTLPATPPAPGFNWATLRGEEVRKIFRDRGMIVLMLGLLASCIPSSFYYSFLNPFLNEVGWTNAAAKMSLGQVLEIGVVVAMPFVFKTFRFRNVIFFGLLAWGIRYFAFAVGRPGHYEWLIYAGILVQGVAYAWLIIASQIYIDNRVPPYLRNTAQGLVSFANLGLGAFFGSWIAGEVVNYHLLPDGSHDWWSIWMVPAVVGTLAAVGFYFLFPKSGRLEK